MSSKEIVGLLRQNIWQAIQDYREHTRMTEVLDDVSDDFVNKLAREAAESKHELRELFRKSPIWDESIQALVINGTRTHNPDYDRISSLAMEILRVPLWGADNRMKHVIRNAVRLFSEPNASEYDRKDYIAAIKEIAPKAYRSKRKKSRIFKSICDALGVTDESAGSDFQRLFAQFADELTTKQIDFKLFVSINPAHFITMSNPKEDSRGNMLTSCHSFNSTKYQWNNGCAGYAMDNVTMIAFTVDDPTDSALLNNRKTSRQLFMYKVGNGLLLQSRMYNTKGGTYGAQAESELYRDLIKREISELEGVPNLWRVYTYAKQDLCQIHAGEGFGGYPDWTYDEFDAKLCIRSDHKDNYEPFTVGTYGMCIRCGCDIEEGLYCSCCDGSHHCDVCGDYCDETTTVHDDNGDLIEVCDGCLSEYRYCEHCEEYYPYREMTRIANGNWVCQSCLEDYYEQCAECGEWFHRDDVSWAVDSDGDEVYICGDCTDSYTICNDCGVYVHDNIICCVRGRRGGEREVCPECRDNNYEICEDCGEYYPHDLMMDGLCPDCRAEREEEQ